MPRVTPGSPSIPPTRDAREVASSSPSVSTAPLPETPRRSGDAFETGTASPTAWPAPPPSDGAGLSAGVAQVALRLSSAPFDIDAEVARLKTRVAMAAKALPPASQSAVEESLVESTERVRRGFAEGALSTPEAERALHMLDELAASLIAVELGTVTVEVGEEFQASSDLRGFDVHTTDGDVLRVGIRPQGHERGQARVKLETLIDDGQPIPRVDRMMIRFDLEGSELEGAPTDASLDVQFGTDPRQQELDKRIHGVLIGPDGQPKLNRTGNTIADHHFADGLDALDDPAAFADFAERFIAKLTDLSQGDAAP